MGSIPEGCTFEVWRSVGVAVSSTMRFVPSPEDGDLRKISQARDRAWSVATSDVEEADLVERIKPARYQIRNRGYCTRAGRRMSGPREHRRGPGWLVGWDTNNIAGDDHQRGRHVAAVGSDRRWGHIQEVDRIRWEREPFDVTAY